MVADSDGLHAAALRSAADLRVVDGLGAVYLFIVLRSRGLDSQRVPELSILSDVTNRIFIAERMQNWTCETKRRQPLAAFFCFAVEHLATL